MTTVQHNDSFNVRFVISGKRAFFPWIYDPSSDVQSSSPFINPSVVISAIERVYWKPEYYIVCNSISILKPLEYLEMHNELPGNRVISTTVKSKDNSYTLFNELEVPKKSKVRILTDVSYLCDVTYICIKGSNKPKEKHIEAIEYRCKHKKYFETPALGCPSFSADVSIATGFEIPRPIFFNVQGVLHHVKYKGKYEMKTFDPICINGVIVIPTSLYEGSI